MKYWCKRLIIIPWIFCFSFCQNEVREIEYSDIKASSQLDRAENQIDLLLSSSLKEDRIPRTVEQDHIKWANPAFDWTEGFFPGTCWYMYEETGDQKWKTAAEKFQEKYEDHKFLKTNHDLGFIFNCSYNNGYRLTNNENFKQILITAGKSLITRFNPVVGAIQSWDVDKGWQSERGWQYPVIIDNMMNLELLFKVSEITGDQDYKDIAIKHANTTLANHFRDDQSSFHVVDYDPMTGEVRSKQTAQGYSDESTWARGQAWGLYGYTVCYRYTKDQKYLDLANNIAQLIISHKNLPEDGIPYWDFNAPGIPDEPRDVSAAAITASALLELDTYSSIDYSSFIHKVLSALLSDSYFAATGSNNYFLLKHSVGSIPHGAEIDVPLIYADYYFIEALTRIRQIRH
jgi:rhamnogalacturonyl hydrolase YesR